MDDRVLPLLLEQIRGLREDMRDFTAEFRRHVDMDRTQFEDFHQTIATARGVAIVAVPAISAIVSVIVGYVLKHL